MENELHKLLWDFEIQSPNLGLTTGPYNNQQKKKRTCRIVDFAVSADHRVKLKESEKKDKYLDLANVVFWPFDPAQNAIQGDAPEGSDTFQWQLGEEIAWAEIGWWNGTS